MFHQITNRSTSATTMAFAAVALIAGCKSPVSGQAPPAGENPELNTRVFRSCFGVNTHFWQNQPLEELDLVQDIGATWIRDEGNWSGEDADPDIYSTAWREKWVNEAHRRGLKVMVHLGLGTPNEALRRLAVELNC